MLPTQETAWEKAPRVLQNAERHYAAGCQWEERGDFGFASAHMVLATEEAAKSAVLAIHGLGGLEHLQRIFDRLARMGQFFETPKVDLHKFFDEVQRGHRQKHTAALYLLTLFWSSNRWGDGVSTEIGFGRLLKRVVVDFIRERKEPASLWAAWCWLARADQLKQQGLYEDVDQPGPEGICAEDFAQAKVVAGSLMSSLKGIAERWRQSGLVRDGFMGNVASESGRLLEIVDREVPRIFTERVIQRVLREQGPEWEVLSSEGTRSPRQANTGPTRC